MKEQENPQPRRFDEFLAELDDGGVISKLDEELPTLMRKVLDVARAKGPDGSAVGTLTLKLAFKVDANGEVAIHAEQSTKAPRMPQALTRRWVNPKTCEIVDANPKQTELSFRDAPASVSEIRSVP